MRDKIKEMTEIIKRAQQVVRPTHQALLEDIFTRRCDTLHHLLFNKVVGWGESPFLYY